MSQLPPKDNHRCSSGFTLVEVLVALVIAILALHAALQIASTQGSLLFEGAHERYAASWADATLAATIADETAIAGIREGTLPGGYHWQLRVTRRPPPPDTKPPVVSYFVELAIYWRSWIGERTLTVNTLKLVPAQAER